MVSDPALAARNRQAAETALGAAFTRAGYVTVEQQLAQIARDVVAMPPEQWAQPSRGPDTSNHMRRLMTMARAALSETRGWDAAKDEFYKRVRGDADLLWELFAPYRSQAAQMALSQASRELREAQAVSSRPGGHASSDNPKGSAPRPNQPSGDRAFAAWKPRNESAGGHIDSDDRKTAAPRAPSAADTRAAMGARSEVVRLSLLDTFKVNGQAIGDLTSAEAIKWAGSRERDARFVRLLTANLPLSEPIRKYRTGDDAAAIYAQAETVDA